MSLPGQMPHNLREEWTQKAALLQENIATYFSSVVDDEKTYAYKNMLILTLLKLDSSSP